MALHSALPAPDSALAVANKICFDLNLASCLPAADSSEGAIIHPLRIFASRLGGFGVRVESGGQWNANVREFVRWYC